MELQNTTELRTKDSFLIQNHQTCSLIQDCDSFIVIGELEI